MHIDHVDLSGQFHNFSSFNRFGTKTIKIEQPNLIGMAQDVPNDLKDLLVRFVQIYSSVTDLELDHYLNPKPWFMPLNSNLAAREAAHYFLIAASLSDSRLTGNPRNIRMLL